ncbi:MAG: ExeA family protein [Planctomyces sp.]
MKTDLGIGVLTGPPGSGKTALLRHLKSLLAQSGRAELCSGAGLQTSPDLLRTLWAAAGLPAGKSDSSDRSSRTTLPGRAEAVVSRWDVTERLQRSSELWGPVLLLIDDAHMMPVSVLNELRSLSEEPAGVGTLVRCLVCGPLAFEEELARPEYSDFSHRIRCHVFLQPMKLKESGEYLRLQLESAGGSIAKTLTQTAVEQILLAADGSPRCLHLLTDETLIIAAGRGAIPADESCVAAALQRLKHLPYHWNVGASDPGDSNERDRDRETGDQAMLRKHAVTVGSERHPQTVIEVGYQTAPESDAVQPTHILVPTRVDASVTPEEFSGRAFVEFGSPETPEPVVSSDTSAAESVLKEELVSDDLYEEVQQFNAVSAPSSAEPLSTDHSDIDHDFRFRYADLSVSPTEHDELTTDPRLPIFDRYTWVELGRDVPSGSAAFVSSMARNLLATENPVYSSSTIAGGAEPVRIVDCADHEVLQALTESSSNEDPGFFRLTIQSPRHLLPAQFEHTRPRHLSSVEPAISFPAASHELTAIDGTEIHEPPVTAVTDDEISQAAVRIAESLDQGPGWQDGQLLEKQLNSDDDLPVSIPFPAAHSGAAMRTETDHEINEESGFRSDLHDPDDDSSHSIQDDLHFYTLAVPLPATSAGLLRAETRLLEDIQPLAQTVADIQADMARFRNADESGSSFTPEESVLREVGNSKGPESNRSEEDTLRNAEGLIFSQMFSRLRRSRESQ